MDKLHQGERGTSKQKMLVVLLGPTGVGKTELSLSLAEHFDIPIINADSRQVFKEIPIGTAAPTPSQLSRRPHYFVGTKSISDYYSAAMYERDVTELISKSASGLHLLSGGSMMYIDAVCHGIDDLPTIDDATRSTFKRRLAEEGLEALTLELREKDPLYWSEVDLKNPRRVVHALEICELTGKPYSSLRKRTTHERAFRVLKIGLNRSREELYERINQRVEHMMAAGLLDEVRRMLPHRHENALNTVGYKELFAYLDGTIDLNEAVRQIQSNTRRYCRKQLTWFRRDESIHWFHPDRQEDITALIEQNI